MMLMINITNPKKRNDMRIHYMILTILAMILISACENENETIISYNNATESHNLGLNCMSCHWSGGSGEGSFTVAGSLYINTQESAYPNGSIKITTEPNSAGTLIKTIEIDSKGNFYTTEAINLGNGLYVGVYGTNGEKKFMSSKITSGACNSCHGNSTDKIHIE